MKNTVEGIHQVTGCRRENSEDRVVKITQSEKEKKVSKKRGQHKAS